MILKTHPTLENTIGFPLRTVNGDTPPDIVAGALLSLQLSVAYATPKVQCQHFSKTDGLISIVFGTADTPIASLQVSTTPGISVHRLQGLSDLFIDGYLTINGDTDSFNSFGVFDISPLCIQRTRSGVSLYTINIDNAVYAVEGPIQLRTSADTLISYDVGTMKAVLYTPDVLTTPKEVKEPAGLRMVNGVAPGESGELRIRVSRGAAEMSTVKISGLQDNYVILLAPGTSQPYGYSCTPEEYLKDVLLNQKQSFYRSLPLNDAFTENDEFDYKLLESLTYSLYVKKGGLSLYECNPKGDVCTVS